MERREFPQLGESCYYQRLDSGLPVFVLSRPGYGKAHACLAVAYGGMHRRFRNVNVQDTPAGIAHFLEHKMFDLPDGNALEQLCAMGATANAFTSSDLTAYHFTCTDRFQECLRTLLRFVTTPYFTPQSVKKEQGIIGQEIRMSDDHPNRRVYRNLLSGLYRYHPVRERILGTEESIVEITPELLEACYRAFYQPENMVLCVIGDVDPNRVFSVANMVVTHETKMAVEPDYGPAEPAQVYIGTMEEKMPVSAPRFLLGFKAKPTSFGENGLRHRLIAGLAGELLWGRSSPLYAKLYSDGLIQKDFTVSSACYPGASFLCAGGESANPELVREMVLEEGIRLSQQLDQTLFQQMLKAEYGLAVRRLNSFESTAAQMARCWFRGSQYLDFASLYPTLTGSETADYLNETIREGGCTLSVVRSERECAV